MKYIYLSNKYKYIIIRCDKYNYSLKMHNYFGSRSLTIIFTRTISNTVLRIKYCVLYT